MPDARPGIGMLGSKLAARLRSRGIVELMGLTIDRLAEEVWSNAGLIVFSKPAEGDAPTRDGSVFRAATPADGDRYARDVGTDSAQNFARRLSEATRCYVVEHEGRFLHSTWVTTAGAWTREIRRYFRPPPGDAYIYESFTRAEARGQGLYPFALANITAVSGAAGVTRLWVAAEEDNAASIRSITKASFEEVFRISYRRRLGHLRVDEPTGEPGHPCSGCITSKPPPSSGV